MLNASRLLAALLVAGSGEELELGRYVAGSITSQDPVAESPELLAEYAFGSRHAVRHAFRAEAAGELTVVVGSACFPAYVLVRGDDGTLLAESTDQLLERWACATFAVEAGTSVRIEVCAPYGTGAYEVGVERMSLADLEPRAEGVEAARADLEGVEALHPGNDGARAHALLLLGRACLDERELEQARACFSEARDVWRALGATPQELDCTVELAAVEREDSDLGACLASVRGAAEQYAEHLGPWHRRTVSTRMKLGVALEALAEYREAESIYRSLLTHFDESPGRHPTKGHALQNLAALLGNTNRPQEALPLYVRAVEAFRRSAGKDLPDALLGYASGLMDLQRSGEAEVLLEEALGLYEQACDRSGEAAAWNNLYFVFSSQRMTGRAERALQRSLEIKREIYPEPNLSLATGLNNYGFVLRGSGRAEESLPLFREAQAIARSILGDRHITLATYLVNEGGALAGLSRLDEADERFAEALEIFEANELASHPNAVQGLMGMADVARRRGDLDSALELYGTAAERTVSAQGVVHPVAAQARTEMARLHERLGDAEGAVRFYEQALASHGRQTGQAAFDCRIRIAKLRGDYQTLETLFQEFLEEPALQGGDYAAAIELNNLARLAEAEGYYRVALGLNERALAIKREVLPAGHFSIGYSLDGIGGAYRDMGRYDVARPYYEEALEIARGAWPEDHPELARALNNYAALLWSNGLGQEALPLMRRGLEIRMEALGLHHFETSESLNGLGAVLELIGDLEGAREHYARALEVRRVVLGPDHTLTAQSSSSLGVVLVKLGRLPEAEAALREALAINERALAPEHVDTTIAMNNLAGVLTRRGAYEEAEDLLDRALAIRERRLGEEHFYVAITLAVRSELREARGDHAGAAADLQRTLELRERLLARQIWSLSASERFEWSAGHRPLLDRLLALTAAHPSLLATRDVYERLVRWKGFVSKGLFDQARRIRARMGEAGVQRLEELADVLARLKEPEASPEERASLALRKNQIERELSRELGDPGQPLERSAAEVLGALAEDEAVLDYFVFDDGAAGPSLAAFVLRRDEDVARVDLGSLAPIASGVEQRLAGVRARGAGVVDDAGRAAERAAAEQTAALLWTPVQPLLAEKRRVFLVPDGPVALVPFAALRDEAGYLVERVEFVYLQSALERLEEAASAPGSASALLVGGLEYGPAAAPAGSPAEASTLEPLPGAAREVAVIAGIFERSHAGERARILAGAEVDQQRLREALPGTRFVHLATHGVYDERADEDLLRSTLGLGSRLALSGANAGPEGQLTAEEASLLDLRSCELAVLSACESGRGRPTRGESVIGLRRALRQAGARSTLTTLWRIEDAEATAFMEEFYRQLWEEGATKAEALRRTQQALLRRAAESGTGSLGWAAFLLEGDWR